MPLDEGGRKEEVLLESGVLFLLPMVWADDMLSSEWNAYAFGLVIWFDR